MSSHLWTLLVRLCCTAGISRNQINASHIYRVRLERGRGGRGRNGTGTGTGGQGPKRGPKRGPSRQHHWLDLGQIQPRIRTTQRQHARPQQGSASWPAGSNPVVSAYHCLKQIFVCLNFALPAGIRPTLQRRAETPLDPHADVMYNAARRAGSILQECPSAEPYNLGPRDMPGLSIRKPLDSTYGQRRSTLLVCLLKQWVLYRKLAVNSGPPAGMEVCFMRMRL
jgi:hypothetical protein